MTTQQAMDYIFSFSHLGAPVQDLSRVAALLRALGNPQDGLRFVHVAGTNGKGSVVTYLSEIAQAAGYRTASFTSPFIHRFSDRIRINGADIPDAALVRCCEQVRAAAPSLPFSQFEIILAIALLWFQAEHCELVCWETGIGGRLDATNVITPLVSVITSVSMDHTAILGDTLEKIAAQKAGIIKPERPVVLSAGNAPGVVDVVSTAAEAYRAPLRQPEPAALTLLESSITGSRFVYRGAEYCVSMPGAHQLQNAMTALEVVELLRAAGYNLQQEAVQRGLTAAVIGARIEVLRKNPLLLLDGGHNPDGMAALCDTLTAYAPKPVFAVLGVLQTKDVQGVTARLSAVAEQIFCVDGFAPNAVPSAALAAVCGGVSATLQDGINRALSCAAAQQGTAVICGSLYLAAQVAKCRF